MIALKSSGSSLAESAVDPTRSQNRTVSCRRSIGREHLPLAATAGESTRRFVPQSPQNLLDAGFAASQAGQRRTSSDPHCPQNFLGSATSIAQLLHHIRTSTEVNEYRYRVATKSNDPCDPDHTFGVPSVSIL